MKSAVFFWMLIEGRRGEGGGNGEEPRPDVGFFLCATLPPDLKIGLLSKNSREGLRRWIKGLQSRGLRV